MDKEYEKAMKILLKEFGKIRKMYLAVSTENKAKVKTISTYYLNESFYFITHGSTDLMKLVSNSSEARLCSTASFHKFKGKIKMLGHPLKERNKEIRESFIITDSKWYSNNFDETDDSLVLVEISLNQAFTYKSKKGYNIDFENNEFESFKFAPNS